MSLFSYFRNRSKRGTAQVAKERLQIIVAHERGQRGQPDFLPQLQKDILEVIRRYVSIDGEQVNVKLETVDECTVLELNVPLEEKTPS